jgi:hypothetical protein
MSVLDEVRRLFEVGRGLVLAVPLMVGGSAVLTGCAGPDLQALCEASEECTGGNEKDIDACVARAEYEAEIADIIGCTSEYEDYTSCFIDEASCKEENQGAPCTTNTECNASGFARCSNGTCVSSVYRLSDDTVCEVEDNTYDSCRDF